MPLPEHAVYWESVLHSLFSANHEHATRSPNDLAFLLRILDFGIRLKENHLLVLTENWGTAYHLPLDLRLPIKEIPESPGKMNTKLRILPEGFRYKRKHNGNYDMMVLPKSIDTNVCVGSYWQQDEPPVYSKQWTNVNVTSFFLEDNGLVQKLDERFSSYIAQAETTGELLDQLRSQSA